MRSENVEGVAVGLAAFTLVSIVLTTALATCYAVGTVGATLPITAGLLSIAYGVLALVGFVYASMLVGIERHGRIAP